jgi:hypothetical protein
MGGFSARGADEACRLVVVAVDPNRRVSLVAAVRSSAAWTS